VVVGEVELHRRNNTIRSVTTDSTDPGEPEGLSIHTAELDVVESGAERPNRRPRAHHIPPQVRLGTLLEGGIAPAVAAIVERGVRRRPAMVAGLRVEVELKIEGPYPPVRVVVGDKLVLVEDGPAVQPDIRIEGGLTDLISMMVTPMLGGLPNLMDPKGRAAIGKVAFGHVRVEGRLGLMRRLLAILKW
jgi:hypothetical protein